MNEVTKKIKAFKRIKNFKFSSNTYVWHNKKHLGIIELKIIPHSDGSDEFLAYLDKYLEKFK